MAVAAHAKCKLLPIDISCRLQINLKHFQLKEIRHNSQQRNSQNVKSFHNTNWQPHTRPHIRTAWRFVDDYYDNYKACHHTSYSRSFTFCVFRFHISFVNFSPFLVVLTFFFCRIENKIHRRTLEWISFSRRAITAQIHNDVLINLHVRPFRFFHFFSSLCAARFRFHFFDVFFSLFLFVLTANVLLVHSQFFFCFFPMINHALKL